MIIMKKIEIKIRWKKMSKSSKQEEGEKTTWTGMGMLVTLVKAMGASNKWINSPEQGLFLCFVQESDFHHQLYCLIFITKWTLKKKL
jgi:hypothetical protein